MDPMIARMLGELLLPPTNIIVLLVLGLWWRRYWPKLAHTLLLAGAGLLLLLSLPLVADVLCRQLERYPPLTAEQAATPDADAIVVLAGGWRRAEEYGGATVNGFSLERLTYGVWLHRRNGLPLAVTGGRVKGAQQAAEADLMAVVLEDEFQIEPRWVETGSRNTAENAANTVALLEKAGVGRILLVTHAFHMPRALPAFEARGIEVIAAPMGFYASRDFRFSGYMLFPSTKALGRSYLALHELLGRAWYQLRYAKPDQAIVKGG